MRCILKLRPAVVKSLPHTTTEQVFDPAHLSQSPFESGTKGDYYKDSCKNISSITFLTISRLYYKSIFRSDGWMDVINASFTTTKIICRNTSICFQGQTKIAPVTTNRAGLLSGSSSVLQNTFLRACNAVIRP